MQPTANQESPRKAPGAGNMLMGYALLGLQPLPVAWLARHDFGSSATVFVRFLFAGVCLALICIVRGRGLRTNNPRLLALRGLFGGTAVLLYFYSIQSAGAARGTILNYTYPIWANLLSFFLGERPQKRFWVTLGLAIVGVWLIVLPEQGWGERPMGRGELSGLLSAICAGAAVLTIKKLRATDDSLTIIFGFTVFGILFSAPLTDFGAAFTALRSPLVVISALSVGALSFLGHVLFTRGYRGVSLSQGTLLSLTVPVVAALGGIVILHEPVSKNFLLGSMLVLAALLTSLRVRRP